jgi:hypothetical protein
METCAPVVRGAGNPGGRKPIVSTQPRFTSRWLLFRVVSLEGSSLLRMYTSCAFRCLLSAQRTYLPMLMDMYVLRIYTDVVPELLCREKRANY